MDTTTSATTIYTPTRRTALTALALTLVAILLTGIAAPPAGATPRSPTVDRANKLIEWCFNMGGEPVVIMDSTGESITVACVWPDGDISFCDASKPAGNGPECSVVTNLSPVQRRLAAAVNSGALPQAQSVPNGQAVPVAQAVAVRQGTHVALSGGKLILVVDDRP